MHRNATRSVVQELSTLALQFAHTLLLRDGCGRVFPVFPASMPRPLQPFDGSRSGTGAVFIVWLCSIQMS